MGAVWRYLNTIVDNIECCMNERILVLNIKGADKVGENTPWANLNCWVWVHCLRFPRRLTIFFFFSFGLGSFDSLRVFFTFKRRTSYFIIQYYLPCAFIVLLSWLGFWINRNAVPARVSLTITCILTSMLLFSSVNSSLPRISYLKSVDYYLITSFGFIVASTIEYALVLNVLDSKAGLPITDPRLLEKGYKISKVLACKRVWNV